MMKSERLKAVLRLLSGWTDAELYALREQITAELTRHWLGNPPQIDGTECGKTVYDDD